MKSAISSSALTIPTAPTPPSSTASFGDYDLDETVQLVGYQPDEVLERSSGTLMCSSTFASPPFEGASASLMQGLALGKPTLVYETAGFAELPDDAVVKVPPADRRALITALSDS